MRKGLGRLWVPDERDQRFQLRRLLPQEPSPLAYRYWWDNGIWLDQGLTSQCVAYSWTHRLADAPSLKDPGRLLAPDQLYWRAQVADEWPGEDYDGTSIRAGAKVLQSMGYIGSYYWSYDLATTVETILRLGPVVIGTYWYEGMDTPDRLGLVHPSGLNYGGHAYVLNGVSRNTRRFRIKNSWGRSWGREGRAFLSFDDFETLLAQDGEVCYLG
jgi:hypothetical protein